VINAYRGRVVDPTSSPPGLFASLTTAGLAPSAVLDTMFDPTVTFDDLTPGSRTSGRAGRCQGVQRRDDARRLATMGIDE
jgi:hypothetical protein